MRANNEGSVYLRKDGRWVASVTELKDGARKRVTRYAATEEEARRVLTELKQRQDAHLPVHFDRQTVAEWLEFWLDRFVRPFRKPSTWASYDRTIRNYVLPAIGQQSLVALAPELIQELLSYHYQRGCERTAQYIRTVLRAALKRAVKLKRLPWNPIDALDTLPVNTEETQVFTAGQAEAFLEAAGNHRLKALFWVAIGLGLRKGELTGLMLEDIQLSAGESGLLTVRRTLQRIKLPGAETSSLVEGSPKAKKSRRELALPTFIFPVLADHLVLRDEERLLASSAWQESGRLFTTPIGTSLDGDNLTKAFRALCDEAQVPHIRFHDLRHSCGTFLHAQGASPFTIQDILGHSQLATTRRYTHVDHAIHKAALDRVGELFQPKKAERAVTADGQSSEPHKPRLVRVK